MFHVSFVCVFRFSRVSLKDEPIAIGTPASQEEIESLFAYITNIDPSVDINKTTKADIQKCPQLLDYLEKHARSRRYMFQLKKCFNAKISESMRCECAQVVF